VPSAVVHAGAEPVLVDVGANFRIDVDDFEAKLSNDIEAVIISHMRGHTSDMDAIMALCEGRGIPVIEDAAHSLVPCGRAAKSARSVRSDASRSGRSS
jgi:dTDP-4-amino-4,6-dideoxygalactose transaminase